MPLTPNTGTALDGILVVELGERIGVGACGSLLSQLGADVVLVEPPLADAKWKWQSRNIVAAGKRSLRSRGEKDAELSCLLGEADVVLISSDVAVTHEWQRPAGQIVCDVTAFGNSGPLRSKAYSDALVQAMSGVVDTTGDPTGPPTFVGLPVLEFSAGIYAAVAVIAALHVREKSGDGQDIDIALFDCAFSSLATFLPFPCTGKNVSRAGNKHSLASPWNAYPTKDGWVLICTATDDQWARLCTEIGRSELVRAVGFTTNPERVSNASRVDSVVEEWTRQRTVEECIQALGATGIACGPILTLSQLATHENLLHRGMVLKVSDIVAGGHMLMPGSAIKFSTCTVRQPTEIPAVDSFRGQVSSRPAGGRKPRRASGHFDQSRGAYAGLRVLEIGQYTTAPLVARQLAALGAEVIKLEPPGGEGSRNWPPHQGDQGYFFTFSNSDKRSVVLDLRTEHDKREFKKLLSTTDVLVENLKPGSLARLGFGFAELNHINPKLVYCAISGFGLESIYPGRPAFDTVVQAMCGFMDLTRSNGTPTKAGISAADIMGGEIALLSIVAALAYRDRTQHGQAIDISMQDAAVWATQLAWDKSAAKSRAMLVECVDGYLAVDGASEALQRWGIANGLDAAHPKIATTKHALETSASEAGLIAVGVSSVGDLLNDQQVEARNLLLHGFAENGVKWPLLNSPLRFSLTPTSVRRPIGALGEANKQYLTTSENATRIL